MWITTKILKNTKAEVAVATNNTIRYLLETAQIIDEYETTGIYKPTSLCHEKAGIGQRGGSFYIHIKNVYMTLKTAKKTQDLQHIS